MAEFISRTSLPAPSRGKGASVNPSLGISEMGGVRVNKALYEKCKDALGLHLGWDEAARKATFTALMVLPKGVTKEDLFDINMSAKGGQATIQGLAPFLRMKEYDFKASGNQTMALTINEAKAGYQFSFVIPKGHLTPPVKQVRKPRTPKVPKAIAKINPDVEQSVADLV